MLSRVHSRGTVGSAIAYFFNTTDQTFFLHVAGAAAAAVVDASVGESRGGGPTLASLLHELPEPEGGAEAHTVRIPSSTPPSLIVAIERAVASNGSLTQIYIPRGVVWNVSTSGAAAVDQVRASRG
jgi:hypothetical protein